MEKVKENLILSQLKLDVETFRYTLFFYKQHSYKQGQAKIGKKIKQKPGNILRLNFRYLKIICFLHPHNHPKIIGDTLKMCKKEVRLF